MKGHYLKPNAENELPSRAICVDTETYISPNEQGEVHTLRLGCAYYIRRRGERWEEENFSFYKKEEFWAYLDRHLAKGTCLYLIGHNTAYDYAILDLDNYLSSRGFEIKLFVINQAFIIKAQLGKCSLKIIDTMNWFKAPLRRLGQVFGIDKGEIADFQKATNEELLPYCMNDANIVKTVFLAYIDFVRDNDLGNFAVTSASQAFAAYRHRFMQEKSILIHGDPKIYELEQTSYRGGRCDIFKRGEFKDIIKLDINSMYPFVMHDFDYPSEPVSSGPITGISPGDIPELLARGDFIVADLDINLTEPFLAVKKEKLLFPIGRIKNAKLTSPEIEYLLESGGSILKVNSLILYKKSRLFSSYVDFFYSLKSNAKTPVMRELSKLFLNSLYGKFGQRENGAIEIDESPENEMICSDQAIGSFWVISEGKKYKVIKIGEKFYRITPQKPTPGNQSAPIIASAVTSYARVYLWKLMKIAGIENVYYCDTDSIFTNRAGYEKLESLGYIDGKQLGKLKVEGIGDCIIRGPKDYDWIDQETGKLKRTIKGVPSSAVDLGDGKFEYRQWTTGLTRYHNDSSSEVVISNKVKLLSRSYDKGVIDPLGNVHPLELDDYAYSPKELPEVALKSSGKRVDWTFEHKRECSALAERLKISVLQAHHLLNKVKLAGYDTDVFPWDELDSSLSYREKSKQIDGIVGRGIYGEGETFQIIRHGERTMKQLRLNDDSMNEEMVSVSRELMNALHDDIFG